MRVLSFFKFTWIMPSSGGVATCVEIKIVRRVRAEPSRRPPRHRRDACSMASSPRNDFHTGIKDCAPVPARYPYSDCASHQDYCGFGPDFGVGPRAARRRRRAGRINGAERGLRGDGARVKVSVGDEPCCRCKFVDYMLL